MAKPGSLADTLQQQAAQGRSIPSIPTLPPKSLAVGTRELKRIVISNLQSSNTIPISVSGDFIYVESITAVVDVINPVALVTEDMGPHPLFVRSDVDLVGKPLYAEGSFIRFPNSFTVLEITNNPINVALALVLWVGFGDFSPGIQRTGPLTRTLAKTFDVTSAVAYANNDCVGSGVFVMRGAFLPGYNYSKIVRARLTINRPVTAGASFALVLWNGGGEPLAFVDHTQFAWPYADIADQVPLLMFPSFVTGGAASDMAICELTDFSMSLTKKLTGNPYENAIAFQLVANDAYVPANPTQFRLDLTVEPS